VTVTWSGVSGGIDSALEARGRRVHRAAGRGEGVPAAHRHAGGAAGGALPRAV